MTPSGSPPEHVEQASVVHICPGPSWERSTADDDRPTRWCFSCRKHLTHAWSLMDDPPERQPSYYEAVPVCLCSRCGRDETWFPGTQDGPSHPSREVWDALVANAKPLVIDWEKFELERAS